MLKSYFLLLSILAVIKSSSQSPIQIVEDSSQVKQDIDGIIPITVLTSYIFVRTPNTQLQEASLDIRNAQKWPITALTSKSAHGGHHHNNRATLLDRDDEITTKIPISVMTSWDFPTLGGRHEASAEATMPTPTKTNPALANLTATAVAIPTKSLKNCNVQGTATSLLLSKSIGALVADDAMGCQLRCMYVSRCQAYSFAVDGVGDNCVFYAASIDGEEKVVGGKTGVFFSDKYPSDGTNFCYGSAQL